MGKYIRRRCAGPIASRSLPWLGVLITSELFWLFATHLSSGQVPTNPTPGDSRAIRSQIDGRHWIGPELSRVMSMQRPIAFEPNRGQTIQRFKFLGRGDGYNLFIGEREAVFAVDADGAAIEPRPRDSALSKAPAREMRSEHEVVGLRLLGARANSRIEAQDQIPGHINYIIGNDPRRWHTDIPIYRRVVQRGVWPGVDLAYYGNQRQIECDFIVAPRANPKAIELGFVNASELKIDAHGDLLVESGRQKLKLLRPILYQSISGARREIGGRFVLSGKSRVRFEVAAYNHEKPLVIDPAVTLVYSTYLGGSGYRISGYGDYGSAIAVDSTGSGYVTGSTSSVNFPSQHPFQSSNKGYPNGSNAFVTKFSPGGRSLVYSTYLGGGRFDQGNGIVVDSSGRPCVTGATSSSDFPTKNPFQSSLKSTNGNAFVTKFTVDGSSVVYSTYLGGGGSGNGGDSGNGIAVDSHDSAYITGYTYSSDFPTKNPFQDSLKSTNNNAFVTKLSADGRTLVYSTYLGGSGDGDFGNGIAVDSRGSAYIVGYTFSSNFPTKNPFQHSLKSPYNDAFVTKLSADGRSLIYSTYLGGSSYYGDFGHGIAVDSHGSAYVTGFTGSSDFPTKNAFQGSLKSSSGNAFVTKFSPDGRSLAYSTFLGGSGNDALPKEAGRAIAVDFWGSAYVTGATSASDFPTKNAFQGSLKSRFENAFVTKFSADGKSLVYSTYLGGRDVDEAHGIALDSRGSAYVVGYTTSSDFPTKNPFQGSLKSTNGNAFVTKLSFASTIPTPTPTRTPKRTPTSTRTPRRTPIPMRF